jgi:hypothetical protein
MSSDPTLHRRWATTDLVFGILDVTLWILIMIAA